MRPAMRRARREPVQVPEVQKPDRSLAEMKSIRSHRLNRAETRLAEARRHAADLRQTMRSARDEAVSARQRAADFWSETQKAFHMMIITSGEITRRRRQYQKLVEAAQGLRMKAGALVDDCRQARRACRQAQAEVAARRKDAEKLALWSESATAQGQA